ncbi:MAG TPA: PepSY-associated TM helix domain-containing protein, partial [Acidobacteriaceae bacterium]
SERQGITAYIEPHSYRLAGDVDQQATWVGWMDRFHVDLLLPKDGRQWNGAGGIVLCLLTLTGVVIWWPGMRNWSRGLRVDFARSWKRINYDLHSAVGIWTLVFSFVWGLTAIYFAWEAPFERSIQAISPITTARYPEEDLARLESRPVSTTHTPLDLLSVLQAASETVPDGKLEGLFFGSGGAPILTVYMARGEMGDYAKTTFLYFDQLTGRLLYVWRRGENHTLGDWVLWLSVPLHFGTSFGMTGKIAWAIAGLILPLLAITGLLMYWNRWLSKQLGSPRRQS